MMHASIDELYLRWLYEKISPVSVRNPARTYWRFARDLYQKEFIWFVPNDDNRVGDGVDLRNDFVEEWNVHPTADWMNDGCSMLELLIGLSRRLAFMGEGEPRDRFWEMIKNIGIEKCDDKHYREHDEMTYYVDEAMDKIIWRTYDRSGHGGGLFPLDNPMKDQRNREIWAQMAAYVVEKQGVRFGFLQDNQEEYQRRG